MPTATLVDDHLLLRGLVGHLPPGVVRGRTMTTTGWWWRAVAPLASPPSPVVGRHRSFAAALGVDSDGVLLDALAAVGQPGSTVAIHELVPLLPAMARLARDEHLNRLHAEAVVVALVHGARVRVRRGNAGRLPEVAERFDIDFATVDL